MSFEYASVPELEGATTVDKFAYRKEPLYAWLKSIQGWVYIFSVPFFFLSVLSLFLIQSAYPSPVYYSMSVPILSFIGVIVMLCVEADNDCSTEESTPQPMVLIGQTQAAVILAAIGLNALRYCLTNADEECLFDTLRGGCATVPVFVIWIVSECLLWLWLAFNNLGLVTLDYLGKRRSKSVPPTVIHEEETSTQVGAPNKSA